MGSPPDHGGGILARTRGDPDHTEHTLNPKRDTLDQAGGTPGQTRGTSDEARGTPDRTRGRGTPERGGCAEGREGKRRPSPRSAVRRGWSGTDLNRERRAREDIAVR